MGTVVQNDFLDPNFLHSRWETGFGVCFGRELLSQGLGMPRVTPGMPG